ncbi:MAG: FkbM family methyltransferase [Xanthobacteraceae bacterium]
MSIARQVRRISPRTWFYFKSLRYKYYNGEPEIWIVRDLLSKRNLAIDVGSSIGIYSRELAKHAARVVAFEANPRVAKFARLVAPSNVAVENVALSSATGETTLRIPINRRNNAVDDLATIEPKNPLQSDVVVTEKVATKRLDDYGFPGCDFIKIDVEGHEEAVLDGAARLIDTQRPVIMIELDDRFNPGIINRVSERLKSFQYSGYRFFDGGLHRLDDSGRDENHNFIFIPGDLALAAPRKVPRYWSMLHR